MVWGNWSNRLNRWLRRGPPRHYRGPEAPAILAGLEGLVTEGESEWRGRPRLAETYFYPTVPPGGAHFEREAEAVIAGEFRVAGRFPKQKLGFPPEWGSTLLDDDNWLSSLQGLEWLAPLVHAHAGKPEGEYLGRLTEGVADWVRRNPFRGAPSRFSWHDHAAAKRLRLFAWVWEQYRGSGAYEPAFARVLLASVYQHARYHVEERNYRRDSNHGLEAIGALWAAARTFPVFAEAGSWAALAEARLEQWIGDNLSAEGFHREQSPSYHWFVLLRLAAIDRFLRASGEARAAVTEATERAARAWPHLVQPDGRIPGVGDSSRTAPGDWRRFLETRWGRPAPAPAESVGPAAAPEAGAFVVSPDAGYAIFRSRGAEPAEETYLLFRCRAFLSPHCHYDALSFVLHGLGRDWVVDPGYLNYHEWDPRRAYLRSSQAHSVVVRDGRSFRTGRCEVVGWERTAAGDGIRASHELPGLRHTRQVRLTPPYGVAITDEVEARGGWRQLFQLAPDLDVEVVSDREVVLVAPTEDRCCVRQSAGGEWQVIRGQTRPRLQGWYSEAYGEWEAGMTLAFRPTAGTVELQTQLELRPAPAGRGGEDAPAGRGT